MSCKHTRLEKPSEKPLDMRLALGIPLLAMVLLLVFEPTTIDLWIADHLYVPNVGFVGRHSYFLEDILHDRVKQVAYAVPILALAAVLLSYWRCLRIHPLLKENRRRLAYLFLAMSLSTGMVMPLKRATEVQCPWSLDRYGGVEHYSSLTSPRAAPVKHSGLCWPGGHASAGFSFFALFFALRDISSKKAKKALIAATLAGTILGFGRMLQGAHFLSHNIWTMLIDWSICTVLYRFILSPNRVSEKPCRATICEQNLCTASTSIESV